MARTFALPVRVQWSRADQYVWDPKGPPTLIEYTAALDSWGNVVAWNSEAWLPAGQSVSRATLVDRPREAPWGAGEPTAAVVPSAISNAIFDATGVRMRSVPFTPEKMLERLKRV
jgi:hypothetical protein